MTSTTSLHYGCGCCDNWCWCCLPVVFLLPELIGNGEKVRRMFIERSQECESIILVPPLQFSDGLSVLTHTTSFRRLVVLVATSVYRKVFILVAKNVTIKCS